MSPNARSRALLEDEGFLAEICEHRVTKIITRDLFGVIDVLGIRDGDTLAVQATTVSNIASRRRKLRASDALPRMLAAGWRVELHGWTKKNGRWQVRREAARPDHEGLGDVARIAVASLASPVVEPSTLATVELPADQERRATTTEAVCHRERSL